MKNRSAIHSSLTHRLLMLASSWVALSGLASCLLMVPEASAQRRMLSAPPVVLFIGQDSDTIAEYAAAIPEHKPRGVTLYTGLRSADPEQTLDGLFAPYDGGAGEIHFDKTLEAFPNAILAVGLSLTDGPEGAPHPAKIAAGEYDASLTKMVEYFAGLKPRSVFLRIGYEFDGPWNSYEPESYKQAFRTIREALRKGGADNVVTVWQSAAWPDPTIAGDRAADYDQSSPEHLESWYPGDDVVDWVGLSIFHFDNRLWTYEPPQDIAAIHKGILDFARARGKGAMIAETAPQGYDIGGLEASPIQRNQPREMTDQQIWARWYQPLFDFVYANRDVVRAVAYINTNWQTQPMWQCSPGVDAGQEGCSNGQWGDSRIQANDLIKRKWLAEVLKPKIWLQSR